MGSRLPGRGSRDLTGGGSRQTPAAPVLAGGECLRPATPTVDVPALWIEDTALECWPTCGPGGQPRYSDAAVKTSLMLRTAFKLPLRQTEGLLASVLTLMKLTISVPDHTTVSRRAVKLPVIQPAQVPRGALHVLIDSTGLQVYGAGQWLEAKHGAKSRRKRRKLQLAVDADSGMIVAQTLTDQGADDPSQVAPLLDQIGGPITRVTADGAYDGIPTYKTIAAHGDGIKVVIPPRSTAVRANSDRCPGQRASSGRTPLRS
jgi:hypothetical protein